jgi:hypothetical protein
MFTGARKDGGADVVEVVKTWSSLILVQSDTTAMVLRSLLCCLSSDSSKNQLAFEANECLLCECCWMNFTLLNHMVLFLKSVCLKVMVPDGLKMVRRY